jgi:hypothetical protein
MQLIKAAAPSQLILLLLLSTQYCRLEIRSLL